MTRIEVHCSLETRALARRHKGIQQGIFFFLHACEQGSTFSLHMTVGQEATLHLCSPTVQLKTAYPVATQCVTQLQ